MTKKQLFLYIFNYTDQQNWSEMLNRPKINKFLCCYDLTVGGLWIGWISFFGSIVFIFLDIFCMVLVYLKGCEEFQNFLNCEMKMTEDDLKICEIGISSKMNEFVITEFSWINKYKFHSYLSDNGFHCFWSCFCFDCCSPSHARIGNSDNFLIFNNDCLSKNFLSPSAIIEKLSHLWYLLALESYFHCCHFFLSTYF